MLFVYRMSVDVQNTCMFLKYLEPRYQTLLENHKIKYITLSYCIHLEHTLHSHTL